MGSNYCKFYLTQKECHSSSEEFQAEYLGTIDKPDYPKGCFYYRSQNQIYF